MMILRRWFIERKKRANFILIKFSIFRLIILIKFSTSQFIILIKFLISQFIILIKFLTFSIKRSFSDFFIQMKNFLACHHIHAKATFINNREYYRKWCDDENESEKKNDVILIKFSILRFIILIKFLIFSIRKSFSDFFHTDENFFACHQMHAKTTLINDRKYYKK
jgi:hypothetical protein